MAYSLQRSLALRDNANPQHRVDVELDTKETYNGLDELGSSEVREVQGSVLPSSIRAGGFRVRWKSIRFLLRGLSNRVLRF